MTGVYPCHQVEVGKTPFLQAPSPRDGHPSVLQLDLTKVFSEKESDKNFFGVFNTAEGITRNLQPEKV